MDSTPYLIMKVLHVAAAMLFLGNIIIGILWKTHGDRSRDPRIVVHTLRWLLLADRWFTMPGVTILLITGFGAQGIGKVPLSSFWILAGLIVVVVSGVVFMARVGPVQKQMLGVAETGVSGQMDWVRYERLSRRWNLWGTVATVLPIIALVLMIWKPV
jgi:uncharacterized membrane protein